MGVYCIQPSLASSDFVVRCQECFLYTYTGVGLSALLVSTDKGNAKAYESWSERQTGSTFFRFVYPIFNKQLAVVARQPS